MIRAAVNWIASAGAVLLLLVLSVEAFGRAAQPIYANVVFGIMFALWALGAAFGLFGRLLKKRFGHLAVGCFMLGFAIILAGQAIGAFESDPSIRFNSGGDPRDWFSDLIVWVYREFGPWGAAALFVASSAFFCWLASLAFREKVSNSSSSGRESV